MKNVNIIKLLNGQEIIAEVIENDTSSLELKVKNPTAIMIVPSKEQPNVPTLALAPFSQLSKQTEYSFNRMSIITMMEPVPELLNEYIRIKTGLITPVNKLVK